MDLKKIPKSWIAYLSTYPPRECGIGTFTADLASAIENLYGRSIESKIVALNLDKSIGYPYGKDVIFQISQPRPKDYVEAAKFLNSLERVRLVNIQHEFGIFGGNLGSHLIRFLEALEKPVITTFHTVLPKPNKEMLDIVQRLGKFSKAVVVMTKSSKKILETDYRLPSRSVSVIPHGIPAWSYSRTEEAKKDLGFEGRHILLTFGLMSRNKGIEYVLEALKLVVKEFPNLLYLVVGSTHPTVLRKEGESYRNMLLKKVYDLRLSNHVRFYNHYVKLDELYHFFRAADIYVSPSLDKNQSVSGTLSYALGAGRAVVSTAFPQAREIITQDTGILTDFRNPRSFARAIIQLLRSDTARENMARRAYFSTRGMTWSNVALRYLQLFSKFIPQFRDKEKTLPPLKLTHLLRLTDDFGIIQFAKLTEPDIASGYTLDDNARAMVVACMAFQKFRKPIALDLIKIYLNFLAFVQKRDGSFYNYVGKDRLVDHGANVGADLEDANARGLWALAAVLATPALPSQYHLQARKLWERALAGKPRFTHPRAIAFYIRALSLFVDVAKEQNRERFKKMIRKQALLLSEIFKRSATRSWRWFEQSLTYSNAVICEALFLAHQITREEKFYRLGKETLDFLIKKTFRNGIYLPIGQQGWYRAGRERAYFDQQPEDVSAMVSALYTINADLPNPHYERLKYQAFAWFLGDNLLGQVVYDRTTGGCYDGVGASNINLNQGAESTIAYLLARLLL